MKKIVKLRLKDNPYHIVIGNHILSELGIKLKNLKIGRDAIIITNPVIKKKYGKLLADGLRANGFSIKFIEVPAGEKSKSAFYAHKIIDQIVAYDVFKKIFIIAFGGGVIGDLAGYVAAVYKRGIPYVQVPTTLLAQIDSSIGGKVAIDLPAGKNLVGAFYQPKIVWSDVSVLASLGARQIMNGFSEAIKYGIIYDENFFEYLSQNCQKLQALHASSLVHVVALCSQIKSEVVAIDEKETKGKRTILNFGHTVGHAIEAAAEYNQYHHGEAVGLGMRIATDISYQVGIISKENVQKINRILSDFHLPEICQGVSVEKIIRVMKKDKKFISGKNRFVLVQRIGKVKVQEGIPLEIIRKSIKNFVRA